MMAIQSSNIGSLSGNEPVKASEHRLSKINMQEYITGLERRMDKNMLSAREAQKAKDFLGDLEGQYRYILKHLDSYITDRTRLISKDGEDFSETS